MNTTSASLLKRLREPANQEAWTRFVRLYTPLLYYWANRWGVDPSEANDLVQDVMLVLVQKMPVFEYDPRKTFRGWLRKVARHRWLERKRRRREPAARELAEEPVLPDPAEEFCDQDERQYVQRRALDIMRGDFTETTWQAFWQTVMEGKSAADVAAAQGTTVGAVHAAKFRVLTRLRQELGELLD
ncbi:MAG: sigma-70 family RNA polymerase sigma factor [Gemmataceae bacterium]|nr:sigma-70 family RNA polymerase sigma factor [Gemmataceae bacterium]